MSAFTATVGYGGWAVVLLIIGAVLGAWLIQHWDNRNWERQLAGEFERDAKLAEGRVNQAATAELDEWLATHPQAAAEPVTCQYCTPLNGVTHLCHKGRTEEDTAAAAGMREFRDRMVQS